MNKLKLFRDFLSRLCFCSIARRREARKIDEAKYRMHYASCLPLTQVIAIEPSNIMVTQAFGNNIHLLIKTVEKETHMAPIVRPEETDALTNSTDNERDSLTVTAGDDGMLLPIRTIH
uniref:Uncharacterized protein n=1 Tax=Setaria digitata TaxID=48799 RepID=A0A915PJ86_9BILA